MPSQRQTFRNNTTGLLEIMVEPIPDRYVLRPQDELVVEAEYDDRGDPIAVRLYDGGLQIYPCIWPLNVWINGEKASPDWTSPGPNAVK